MVLLVQCTCRLCWSSVIFVSFTQTRFPLCTMGRRKSKRKPPPKKKMTGDLETQFTCPFCNHEKSCDVKMYSAHLNTPGLWFVGRFLRWLVVSDASSRFVFQQGEKQKHWDNIMYSLLGGVPDPHYLYPYWVLGGSSLSHTAAKQI